MTAKTAPSSQARGARNAAKLRQWLSETPGSRVPRNQFGGAARDRICKVLDIPSSTIRTNEQIKRLFDELDAKLGNQPVSPIAGRKSGTRTTEEELGALRLQYQIVLNENDLMRARLQRLQHLDDTGTEIL
jgi:hypothetical protein